MEISSHFYKKAALIHSSYTSFPKLFVCVYVFNRLVLALGEKCLPT